MNISEKATYIKGLLDGMNFDKNTNEGRLFYAIADLLEDISASVLDLDDEQEMTNNYLDELDEDLGALEADFYGCCDDDDCDDCDCDDCDDCDCDDDDDECIDFYQVQCPNCKETIFVSNSQEGEEITCPNCDTTFKE